VPPANRLKPICTNADMCNSNVNGRLAGSLGQCCCVLIIVLCASPHLPSHNATPLFLLLNYFSNLFFLSLSLSTSVKLCLRLNSALANISLSTIYKLIVTSCSHNCRLEQPTEHLSSENPTSTSTSKIGNNNDKLSLIHHHGWRCGFFCIIGF